jgi:hypothetical protein
LDEIVVKIRLLDADTGTFIWSECNALLVGAFMHGLATSYLLAGIGSGYFSEGLPFTKCCNTIFLDSIIRYTSISSLFFQMGFSN